MLIKACSKCSAPIAAKGGSRCANCQPSDNRGRRHYTTADNRRRAKLRKQANANPDQLCEGVRCLWAEDGMGRAVQPNGVSSWEIDHDTPGSTVSGFRVLHRRCNLDKGGRTNTEWLDAR